LATRAGSYVFKAGGPGSSTFALTNNLRGLQSAGMDNLNIPETKVEELGSELSVDTLFDTPDGSMALESLDFTPDLEAILTRVDPSSVIDGQEFSFIHHQPIDIIAPWKGKYGTYTTVAGIITPYLQLEQFTYRAGVRANATKQATLRGDSVYMCQTTPYLKSIAVSGVGPYSFEHTAVPTVEQGDTKYAYCVTLHHTDGSWDRLVWGVDYTDNAAGLTLTVAPAVTDTIDFVYASATAQTLTQQIHGSLTTYPAALRSRDVDIYISDGAATPNAFTWKGVQTAEMTWRVTLDANEELGNPHYVDRDYDTPEVSGTLAVRPASAAALMTQLRQLQKVSSTTQTLNTLGMEEMEVEFQFNDPTTGDRLETVYCPDARFQPPPTGVRVGQKQDFSLPFKSASGTMLTYAGERP
jgi:hypothetical protein